MNVDPTGNVIKFIPQDGASLTEIVQSIIVDCSFKVNHLQIPPLQLSF